MSNQMNIFNLVVPTQYSRVEKEDGTLGDFVISENDQLGIDLYLEYQIDKNTGKSNANDYLQFELVSFDDFIKNTDLTSQYESYKDYCYSFDKAPSENSKYPRIMEYLINRPGASEKSVKELYNGFNDRAINLAVSSSQVDISLGQAHEAFLGSMASEAGNNKTESWSNGSAYSTLADSYEEQATYCTEAKDIKFYQDLANAAREKEQYYYNEADHYKQMKHDFSDLKVEATDYISNLQYEAINFTSRNSNFDELIKQFNNDFEKYELKIEYVVEDEYTAHFDYSWIDKETEQKVELSNEEQALMLLIAENNGAGIDWDSVDASISKYAKNISYLSKDSHTNYDSVINYLIYAKESSDDNSYFIQQLSNMSNLGFDTEARRRADQYTSDFAAKMFSKIFNMEISDNSDLIAKIGPLGLLAAGTEWLTEDVLLPALHGVDGFIKSIGYAITDTMASVFGQAQNIDFSPSLNDQTWSYIIQNYKDNGGFELANYYVTQAMISIGNQAIPIALSFVSGGLSMAALGISAYGNTLHSTLAEFVQLYDPETGWATGSTPLNAIIYGLLDAGAEMVMEKFVGRMPGLSNATSIGLRGFAKDIVGEMLEESLQEFLGPLMKDMASFEVFKAIGRGEFGEYLVDYATNKVDLGAIRDAAIIAAISSGVMNGARNGPKIVESLIRTNGQSSS